MSDTPPSAGPKLFVERGAYRRRRLRDAARMLPAAGAVLWMVPLLWSPGASAMEQSTVGGWLYLFGVWVLLIIAAAMLSRPALKADEADTPNRASEPGGRG